MSRLFNTLERIRRHEVRPEARRRIAPVSRRQAGEGGGRHRRLLLLAVLAATAAIAITVSRPTEQLLPLAWLRSQWLSRPAPATRLPAAKPDAASPRPRRRPPAPAPTMAQLNNQGVILIRQGAYWRGISLLEQARRLQPARPEPLINLGVALTELGLDGPARRFFHQAELLAPDDPDLRRNLIILARLGITGQENRPAPGQPPAAFRQREEE